MKLLDKKGRVFGINLIDLMVIIVLLCLLPMLWYGGRLSAPKPHKPLLKSPPPIYKAYIIYNPETKTYGGVSEKSWKLKPYWRKRLKLEVYTMEGEKVR